MHDIDILKGYRSMAAEISLLEAQLEKCGSVGAPRGYGQHAWDQVGGRTNNLEAARQQKIDYLTEMLEERKAEMAEVSRRFEEILTGVTDKRMQVILRSYYAVGMTDDSIGELLGLTTRRINALRNSFLRTLEVPEAA